eukprot:1686260-Rhodomonas_salina.1
MNIAATASVYPCPLPRVTSPMPLWHVTHAPSHVSRVPISVPDIAATTSVYPSTTVQHTLSQYRTSRSTAVFSMRLPGLPSHVAYAPTARPLCPYGTSRIPLRH